MNNYLEFNYNSYLYYERLVAQFDKNKQTLSSGELHLLEFAFNADEENREKLSLGFPELIYIIRGWGSQHGFSDLVRERCSWTWSKNWYKNHVIDIRAFISSLRAAEKMDEIEADRIINLAKDEGRC